MCVRVCMCLYVCVRVRVRACDSTNVHDSDLKACVCWYECARFSAEATQTNALTSEELYKGVAPFSVEAK